MQHKSRLDGSRWADVSQQRSRSSARFDRRLLGTGGQNVDDIYKYLPGETRLGMAKRTLEWRHLAPTAPDTLCEWTTPQCNRR